MPWSNEPVRSGAPDAKTQNPAVAAQAEAPRPRREAVEALAPDRANARYTDSDVRARAPAETSPPRRSPEPSASAKAPAEAPGKTASALPAAPRAASPQPPERKTALAQPSASRALSPEPPERRQATVGKSDAVALAPVGSKSAPKADLSSIGVRVGEHADFSRIVFDWPYEVEYEIGVKSDADGNFAAVRFAELADFAFGKLSQRPARHFALYRSGEVEGQTLVVLSIPGNAEVRHLRSGPKVVVDVYPPLDRADRNPSAAKRPGQAVAGNSVVRAFAAIPRSPDSKAKISPPVSLAKKAEPLGPSPAPARTLMATVFFGHGTTDLDPGARKAVAEIAATRKGQSGKMRLIGYPPTSSPSVLAPADGGGRMAALAGSFQRAQTVAGELIRLGIDPQSILIEAKAEARTEPSAGSPPDSAGRGRTEIYLEN
jgi:outer membrane protein OmpA-like peptidoglycan-associated protein